jgi:hypothetical protein
MNTENLNANTCNEPSPLMHGEPKLIEALSEWVLLIDVDFFGRTIYAGTIFRQVNADYYHPMINGARCPSYQVNFMIVKNNPKCFLKLLK